MMNGCTEELEGEAQLHTLAYALTHNARKRPRLRPSYITWNPFVLLQCIHTGD